MLQGITVKDETWDLVRNRLHVARERHSFLATRSRGRSTEVDVSCEETKHWDLVSRKLQDRHLSKRHSRRSSVIKDRVGVHEKRGHWDNVRRSSLRSRHLALQPPPTLQSPPTPQHGHGAAMPSLRLLRRSHRFVLQPPPTLQSTTTPSIASTALVAISRKPVAQGMIVEIEGRAACPAELGSSRWKQAQLRKEQG